MARNGSSVTNWIGNLVDGTKAFADDALDRLGTLEHDVTGLVRDAADNDRGNKNSSGDLENLQTALSDLAAKIDELSRTMEAGTSKSRAA